MRPTPTCGRSSASTEEHIEGSCAACRGSWYPSPYTPHAYIYAKWGAIIGRKAQFPCDTAFIYPCPPPIHVVEMSSSLLRLILIYSMT